MHYRRDRSELWISLYQNEKGAYEGSYNIYTSRKYTALIDYFFPQFIRAAPRGWQIKENRDDMHNLWLPYGKYNDNDILDFENWCHEVVEERLWLGLNKNILTYFSDELDYCIASDWNFVRGGKTGERTVIGEAEYQLKYHRDELGDGQQEFYVDIILSKVLKSLDYLPIDKRRETLVSALPANEEGQEKLAWQLAQAVAKQNCFEFINAVLKGEKPEMKDLTVEEKLEVWNDIYLNNGVELDKVVCEKNIIIIDDLYQSGATIWNYAKYLKYMGARNVMGVTCVKSLRDSDNQ